MQNTTSNSRLPPYPTHLPRPKVAWQKILNDYHKTKVGQKESSVPKDIFPQLLTKLVKTLEEGKGKENLTAGFRKCGIVPLDLTQLLR